MRTTVKRSILGAVAAAAVMSSAPATAQSYPIDCAILLCLAGGWPASTECSLARAEFIRRVTPWPVEPPLQIWRCPMGGGGVRLQNGINQTPLPQNLPYPLIDTPSAPYVINARMDTQDASPLLVQTLESEDFEPSKLLRFIQEDYSDENGTADIDISGPDFDFVRSIRVFHVRTLAQKLEHRRDDTQCKRLVRIDVGEYGTQGDFHWRRGSIQELPAAFEGTDGFGQYCPTVNASKNVFIDWRDHAGNYGFEQVRY